MQNTESVIYFNFSYFALRLLGKGLYSNHWTAIAELVANGLDAQASKVKIYINMIDKQHSTIEIFDDGFGMDYEDLAQKYVLIGRDKRINSEFSDEIKEELMGRKGIGKLAALFLSNKYFLISKTRTSSESAWGLDASSANDSDIPQLVKCDVNSIGIECIKEWNGFSSGTMIRLTNVDLTNFGVKTLDGLKARLADFYLTDLLKGKIEVCVLTNSRSSREFNEVKKSVAFKNFYAFFNNSGVSYENKLSKNVKILTSIPEVSQKDRPVIMFNDEQFNVSGKRYFRKEDGSLTSKELEYKMAGWIGIHTSIKKEDASINDPDFLRNKAYNPNRLRLYVRKKLAVENFLEYLNSNQAFSNYIEGEISFDILDNNELGDIATSNRQGFVQDNERVQLLIEILKPIINYLIRTRIKVANQITQEMEAFYEAERKKQEELRKLAEEERQRFENEKIVALMAKEEAEQEKEVHFKRAELLNRDLSSEKKRNYFLYDSLDEDQVNFAKRLHMLKTNSATMATTIKKNVMLLQRGRFTEKDAWDCLKTMSYLNSRTLAVLEYGAAAKFDTKEEYMEGDLFSFIQEYCEKIQERKEGININVKREQNAVYPCRFVPQDIVIIIDNVVSNAIKQKACNLNVILITNREKAEISFVDDGEGILEAIKNTDELFEFGKSFTFTGTGVGLFHIKEIVENKLNGKVKIISEPHKGFTLRIRI